VAGAAEEASRLADEAATGAADETAADEAAPGAAEEMAAAEDSGEATAEVDALTATALEETGAAPLPVGA